MRSSVPRLFCNIKKSPAEIDACMSISFVTKRLSPKVTVPVGANVVFVPVAWALKAMAVVVLPRKPSVNDPEVAAQVTFWTSAW